MGIFILMFFLELGKLDTEIYNYQNNNITDVYKLTDNIFYTDIGLNLNIAKIFNIGGKALIYEVKVLQLNFVPIQANFEFDININISFLKIGYIHNCLHSIDNDIQFKDLSRQVGNSDKIYIRIECEEKF